MLSLVYHTNQVYDTISLFIKHKANEDIKIVTFYSSSFNAFITSTCLLEKYKNAHQ